MGQNVLGNSRSRVSKGPAQFHEHREAGVAGAVWGSGQGRGGSESSLAGKSTGRGARPLPVGSQAPFSTEKGQLGAGSGGPQPRGPVIHKAGWGVMAWEERQGWGAWAEGPAVCGGVLETSLLAARREQQDTRPRGRGGLRRDSRVACGGESGR